MHPDDLPTITKRQADKMVADAIAKALAAAKPVKVEEYPAIGLGDDYIDAPKSFTVGKGFQYKAVPVEPVVKVQKPVMPPAVMDEAWTDAEDDTE